MQIRTGCAQPPSAVDIPVEGCEPLLPVAVDVSRSVVAGLLGSFQEGAYQRMAGGAPFQDQWSIPAAVLIDSRQAGFHAFEVGKAMGVIPGFHARIGPPTLEVEGVAPLKDHAVDAARASEHLPPGVVNPASVHEGLGLRLVLPVIEPVPDRE